MLEEPIALPADFGLSFTLAQNLNENLNLIASAHWNDCREQWLDLMAQNPQSPLDADWWSARARGTDVSRNAQAIRLIANISRRRASGRLPKAP